MSVPLCKDCRWARKGEFDYFCQHPYAIEVSMVTGEVRPGVCSVLRNRRYDSLKVTCTSAGLWFESAPPSRKSRWKFWQR